MCLMLCLRQVFMLCSTSIMNIIPFGSGISKRQKLRVLPLSNCYRTYYTINRSARNANLFGDIGRLNTVTTQVQD